MEKIIYEQTITRLTSAEAIAYIEAAGQTRLQTTDWYEQQIENALKDKDVKSYPFECPAVFFQFSPTRYDKGNGLRQEASGEFTIHLAQSKLGKDGKQGSESHAAFKSLLDYADLLINVLNDFKLPCSARLVLSNVERDHTNSGLMHDKITFSWTAQRKRVNVA
jgi:hypothetical protein